jgi:hypothetical protein
MCHSGNAPSRRSSLSSKVFTASNVTDIAGEFFCVEKFAVETRVGEFSRKICPPLVDISRRLKMN